MPLKPPDGITGTIESFVDLDTQLDVVQEAPLNVQDPRFGAFGDSVTADGPALRTTLAYALTADSGEIYVPRGVYLADCTSAPLFDVPEHKRITIKGDGSGCSGHVGSGGIIGSSVIKRSAGTNELLRVQGIGDATPQERGYISAKDVMFWGGAFAGDVVYIKFATDLEFYNVRIEGSNGVGAGSGLRLQQLFNSEFTKCYFTKAGSGSATPATVLEPAPGATAGSTDVGGQTVRFVACEWEANYGTDLKVSGSRTNSAPSYGIQLIAPKMEGQITAGTWPVLDLDYVIRMQIVGFDITAGGGAANTRRLVTVPVDGPNVTGQGAINFAGGFFGYSAGSTASPYAIEQLSGFLSFTGVDWGVIPSTTSYVRIGASVDTRGCRIGNSFYGFGSTDQITDERAAGFAVVASAASIRLPLVGTHDGTAVVNITGTADITSIVAAGWRGRQVTLMFTGTAATNGLVDGSNLKLAGNFVYTPDDTISLVCTGSTWHETGRSVN